jgi:hypothetical protein
LGQEFIIKSQNLEDKVNQLLPSQGGFQAGVDLSASTTIIPIIDLTESAEGGTARADLQSALSLASVTSNLVDNTTTVLVNTTGYYRVFGVLTNNSAGDVTIDVTDGSTTKILFKYFGMTQRYVQNFDFIVFLPAGVSLRGISSASNATLSVTTRQLADLNGNLVDPI